MAIEYYIPDDQPWEEVKISLVSLLGERLKTIPVTAQRGTFSLDVSGNRNGVYFLILSAGNRVLAPRRLVIQR